MDINSKHNLKQQKVDEELEWLLAREDKYTKREIKALTLLVKLMKADGDVYYLDKLKDSMWMRDMIRGCDS